MCRITNYLSGGGFSNVFGRPDYQDKVTRGWGFCFAALLPAAVLLQNGGPVLPDPRFQTAKPVLNAFFQAVKWFLNGNNTHPLPPSSFYNASGRGYCTTPRTPTVSSFYFTSFASVIRMSPLCQKAFPLSPISFQHLALLVRLYALLFVAHTKSVTL